MRQGSTKFHVSHQSFRANMVDCGQVGPGQDATTTLECAGSTGPHRGVGARTRVG
jgi:hypothetical protein